MLKRYEFNRIKIMKSKIGTIDDIKCHYKEMSKFYRKFRKRIRRDFEHDCKMWYLNIESHKMRNTILKAAEEYRKTDQYKHAIEVLDKIGSR